MISPIHSGRAAEILLVEDNDNDVILTSEGFKRSHLLVNMHHVRDGEECMAFLRKEGVYADVPMPDMILLDLNMPRMDGWEVMTEIARDEALNHLPVIILTTSHAEKEILSLYKLRCSSYIVKPVDFNKFVQAIKSIGEYWLTVVVMPA